MQRNLFEAALYVQDVALANIEFHGLDSEEQWNKWINKHGQRIEKDADQLFVDNMDQDPVLLTDQI